MKKLTYLASCHFGTNPAQGKETKRKEIRPNVRQLLKKDD
jgi:hypothetical protein